MTLCPPGGSPVRGQVSPSQCLHAILTGLFFVIVAGPLIGLVLNLIPALLSGSPDLLSPLLFTPRRIGLLVASIGLAAAVAGAGMVLGILVVSYLWQVSRRILTLTLLLLLALAAVPPYIHALTWSSLLSGLTNFLPGLTVTGWWISFWVELMAFLPLAIILSWIAIASVDPELVGAGRVFSSDSGTFTRILLPLAAPALGAAVGFLFLVCCSDYSIPSLFGADVYSLDIFAQFAASGSPSVAFLYALPLMFVMAAVLFFCRFGIRTLAQTPGWLSPGKGTPLRLPRPFAILQAAACAIVILQILVLILGLILTMESLTTFSRSVMVARNELAFSLLIAAGVILVSLPLAVAAAGELTRPGIRGGVAWGLVLLPLAMPASLTGIGLILFWNLPGLSALHPGLLMPVLAGVARFAPFAAIILFVQFRFIDPLFIDAARVFSRSRLAEWLHIRLPLYAPGLLVSAGILAVLSLAELGATLVVAPPGHATLTMRIYNYLHYGAAGEVAGLCLMITILSLVAGVCTIMAVARLYGNADPADSVGRW